MGTNQCALCFTPGRTFDDQGNQHCPGCGVTSIRWVTTFLRERTLGWFTRIEFHDATVSYQRSPFPRLGMSFGEWLCQFRLGVIAKP